jgi:hypothetical protein
LVKLPYGLIKQAADTFGIDPDLLGAICIVESQGNTWLIRYEPKWSAFLNPAHWAKLITLDTEKICQMISWGLCQVIGARARELGHEGLLTELLRPDTGLYYGAKNLSLLLKKHGIPGAIAAYNAGSPRIAANGKFINQDYVDKVMSAWDEIKSEKKGVS